MIWIFIVWLEGFDLMNACFAPGVAGLLSPLQDFLDDKEVSEILINRPQEVFVERNSVMLRFELPVLTPHFLRRLFMLIANENKQTLSETSPLLSGNLADGSRIQLVIPEASQHEALSIRKFTLHDVGFDEYARQGFFKGSHETNAKDVIHQTLRASYDAHDWQQFLTTAIHAKKNIIISGATSSGKTTFLNACVALIPHDERLVTLEDTYEIKVPHPNIVRLKALKQMGDRSCGVTMQDLVQASLRLRPDRIIMGEIRGKEVFDFVSACSTGHNGSFATIHADHTKMVFMRMAQLYKLNNVPGMCDADIHHILHEVIDIIVQLKKTSNGRQMTEVYYKGIDPVSV